MAEVELHKERLQALAVSTALLCSYTNLFFFFDSNIVVDTLITIHKKSIPKWMHVIEACRPSSFGAIWCVLIKKRFTIESPDMNQRARIWDVTKRETKFGSRSALLHRPAMSNRWKTILATLLTSLWFCRIHIAKIDCRDQHVLVYTRNSLYSYPIQFWR